MVWVALSCLAALAALLVILPLFRKSEADAADRRAYDQQIYRDQLAEIDHEREAGLIGETQAESARTEIARRLLALEDTNEISTPGERRSGLLLRYYLAGAIPIAVFGVYLMVGSPHLPGQPAAEIRAHAAEDENADPTALIARLGETLQSRPNDVEGWQLYANALQKLRRYDDAIAAWRRVIAITPDKAEAHSRLAEALILKAEGSVTQEARTRLVRALTLDATEPRARYYAGLAASQAGDTEQALVTWMELLADSKPGAPWVEILESRIAKLANEAGLSKDQIAQLRKRSTPDKPPESAPPGPTAEQVRDAAAMSESDRAEMIQGMVTRLAARMEQEPDNPDGWVRLARAYEVLGKHKEALNAWSNAARLNPEKVAVLSAYANAIALSADGQSAPPPELFKISDQILALEPNHGGALWFSGLGKLSAGDVAGAKTQWQHLRSLLDPASEQFRDLSQRLDALSSSIPKENTAPTPR